MITYTPKQSNLVRLPSKFSYDKTKGDNMTTRQTHQKIYFVTSFLKQNIGKNTTIHLTKLMNGITDTWRKKQCLIF